MVAFFHTNSMLAEDQFDFAVALKRSNIPDTNTVKLAKILKKTPEVILLAGILNGKLLNRNEFLERGQLDLVTAQAGLVQILRTAAGGNLNKQLTHHQSTLVTRLKQIGTNNEDKPCDVKE
ncbi:hypothetical protein QAD02_019275 [Eretmocerus hayati]|uniref:Uncharacterized protein n=1 Tax=Eretmocerus hayati TaxID=131215 RepID=A0ACC2PJ55_9HYME|nr:hypothetical protein QAD02_019275 [Eretmocerus hayati]